MRLSDTVEVEAESVFAESVFAESVFKDTCLLDFLSSPDDHSEADLQRALLSNLRRFLIELGCDFWFVGEPYLLQVGKQDFRLDLLFVHRELLILHAVSNKMAPHRQDRNMRIVAISDTHSRHQHLQIPEGDILIHAGDATMMGTVPEISAFNHWLGALPHPVKIVCAGNHDWLFEKNPALARAMMSNARYLQDQLTTVSGLRIYGSPWQPRFFDWAFNLNRGEQLRAKWDLIPHDLDILITHGPPFGILDFSVSGQEHVGCEELRKAVERVRPRLMIFGHIHHSYGVQEYEGTKFVNACTCNENYQPVNPPIVIDLD